MATPNNSSPPRGVKSDIITVIDLAKEVGLHPSNVQKDLRRLGIDTVKQRPPGKVRGQPESIVTTANADRYRAWRSGHPAEVTVGIEEKVAEIMDRAKSEIMALLKAE